MKLAGKNAKRGQNGGKIDERGYRERVFHESFPIASAAFFYVMGDPTQQVVEEQDVHRDKIERGERELPSAGKPVDVEHERNDARKRGRRPGICRRGGSRGRLSARFARFGRFWFS